jgi:hypothetical protein
MGPDVRVMTPLGLITFRCCGVTMKVTSLPIIYVVLDVVLNPEDLVPIRSRCPLRDHNTANTPIQAGATFMKAFESHSPYR